MKVYGLTPIDYEKFSDSVSKDFPVYDNLLEYLKIRPYDLPPKFSASIMSVASLYEHLMRLYKNVLESFVALALLENGFVDEYMENDEVGFTPDDMISFYADEATSGDSEPLKSLSFVKGRTSLTIYFLMQTPMISPRGELSYSVEEATDRLIEDLDKYTNKVSTREINTYIIPDPLLFRLFKKEIFKSKKTIEKKFPECIFLSADEFVNRILADDKEDFIDKFRQLVRTAKANLEKKYPFIKISKQQSVLSRAREEILDSEYKARDLSRNEPSDIIRRATIGVEGLLYSICWESLNEEPKGRDREFSSLLAKSKDILIEDFGPELYDDLVYLNKARNSVSHAGRQNPSKIEMLKVVSKAGLFKNLVDTKYGFQ